MFALTLLSFYSWHCHLSWSRTEAKKKKVDAEGIAKSSQNGGPSPRALNLKYTCGSCLSSYAWARPKTLL